MDTDDQETASVLEEALDYLAGERGLDFRDYRRDTLRNRLAHRMSSLGCADASAYEQLLHSSPDEAERLVEAFLIHVTSFRRDSGVFEALEEQFLPELASGAAHGEPLRAWCVGVATGEEAYSIAMTLARVSPTYEVLGTDLNEDALAIARNGVYPVEAVAELSPELRARWFAREGATYRVVDPIREKVRFTRHDFLGLRLAPTAAVLADFHLLLLRNVLIYLDERLQRLCLDRSAGVLRPGGLLVLGIAETMPKELMDTDGPFEPLDLDLRVFRRREGGQAWR